MSYLERNLYLRCELVVSPVELTLPGPLFSHTLRYIPRNQGRYCMRNPLKMMYAKSVQKSKGETITKLGTEFTH